LFFMKPKVLSRNVRRLSERDKRLMLSSLLRDWKADIVCLQDTKLEFVSRVVVRSLWGCQHVDWCYLGLRGASGGILLMWDRRVVKKIEDCVGIFSVACSFRSVNVNFEWTFAGVYGPNDDSDRKVLWDELVGLLSWWELLWCIGGDIICYPSEGLGDTR
jgi:exonuclease III